MRIWLALLAAPSLALACQSLLFSLATPSCSVQTRLWMHVVAAACLVLALLFTLLARRAARSGAGLVLSPDDDDALPARTRHFLATAAVAVGALSALVILTMWMAAWVLSPCF